MIWGKSLCKTLATFLLLVVVFSVVAPVGRVFAFVYYGGGDLNPNNSAPTVANGQSPGSASNVTAPVIGPTPDSESPGLIVERFQYIPFWLIMQYNSLVIGISGSLFDFTVDKLALNVQNFMDSGDPPFKKVVEDLWGIFRDIGNLIIIFGLLYLAIKTIIEGNGFADKKILASILVAAVLINFSLFFARTAFTLSNKVAVEILKPAGIGGVSGTDFANKLKVLALPNLFTTQGNILPLNLGDENPKGSFAKSGTDELEFIAQAAFGAIILTMLAFVLLFGSFFLITRFIVFLFLFITAGLGFTARFIGFTNKFGDMWWDNLLKHTISLPIFALLMYIALTVTSLVSGKIHFGNILAAGAMANVASSLLYYIIIIAFFAIAVMAPMTIGGAGSKQLGSLAGWGKKHAKSFGNYAKRMSLAAAPATMGVVGRQIGGRLLGDKILSSEGMKKRALEGKWGSQVGLAAGAWLQKRTFDARNVGNIGKELGIGTAEKGGWAQRKKDMKKEQEKQIKEQHEIYGVSDLAKKREKEDPLYAAEKNRIDAEELISKTKINQLKKDAASPAAIKYPAIMRGVVSKLVQEQENLKKIQNERKANDNKVINDFKNVMNTKNNKKVFTIQGLSNQFTRGRKNARGSAIEDFVKSQTKDKSEKDNDELIEAIKNSASKTP